MPYLHNTTLLPQQIFLNSAYSTQDYNTTMKSNMLFQLEDIINVPSNIDCYIQINTFKFFNTFYNVTTRNNVFYFNDTSVTIQPGNYTIAILVSALNELLLSYSIYLIYDSLTFKISIVSVSEISLTLGANHCYSLLGINTDRIIDTLHVSDHLVNLGGVQNLYITFPNIRIKSNGVRGSGLNNVLESININVPIGSSESYANTHSTKFKVNENSISSININIYDETLKLVDFNNSNWYLSLSVIFSYKNQHIVAPDLIAK
jgi:hypothetical protein